MMKNNYDVIIVGAGPAGLMCAYELSEKNKDLNVLLIDKGKNIYNRNCPIINKKIKKCPVQKNGQIGCLPFCSITNGFGGAGAYSDGKFNITSEYGGWMNEYLEDDTILDLIKYADSINLKFGAPKEITDPTTPKVKEIEKKGLAVGLKLLRGKIRHLGTEVNLKVLKNIFEHLNKNIDMVYEEEVKNIIVEENVIKGIILKENKKIYSDYVVITPGRDGSYWLSNLAIEHNINMKSNHVDIGVRVETNNEIMEEINENLYEGKFIYRTKVGSTVRTFCSNPRGHVVIENHSGTMLANGHAYKDSSKGSKNTNFALLVSHKFTEPFNQPNEFAHGVSKLANMLSNGAIILQRFGDLQKGRRSTVKRVNEGFVTPTLKEAIPGDLGLVLPYKTMKSIIEMIEALDYITPGVASEHTLLYGVEAKFYSARPEVNNKFESKINNLYFGGDGAGITRGLAQASANGIWIARDIILKTTNKL